MSWDNRVDLETANVLLAISEDLLKHAGTDRDLLIDSIESGFTFEEIADYLDRRYELPN